MSAYCWPRVADNRPTLNQHWIITSRVCRENTNRNNPPKVWFAWPTLNQHSLNSGFQTKLCQHPIRSAVHQNTVAVCHIIWYVILEIIQFCKTQWRYRKPFWTATRWKLMLYESPSPKLHCITLRGENIGGTVYTNDFWQIAAHFCGLRKAVVTNSLYEPLWPKCRESVSCDFCLKLSSLICLAPSRERVNTHST